MNYGCASFGNALGVSAETPRPSQIVDAAELAGCAWVWLGAKPGHEEIQSGASRCLEALSWDLSIVQILCCCSEWSSAFESGGQMNCSWTILRRMLGVSFGVGTPFRR